MPRHPWISNYFGKKNFYFDKIKNLFGKIIIFFGKASEYFGKIVSTQRLKHRVFALERAVLAPGPAGFSG